MIVVFQNVKGTRDFGAGEARKRKWIFDTVEAVFKSFGFEPLQTSLLADFELLAKKGGGGEEIRREIYCFKDLGGREIGLRYDITVPTARFVAANPGLPKPFKRYEIGPVYRYDNPGAGRYREFWQADVDVFGAAGAEADAEVVAVAAKCLEALGFKDFVVRINNRKVIEGFLEKIGVKKEKAADVFRSVDKLEKFGEKTVRAELEAKGLDKKTTSKILEFVEIKNLKQAKKLVGENDGVSELEKMVSCLQALGVKKFAVDMSLVRGLDYYTGAVFEVAVEGGKWSVAGGGRFDNLIELYGGKPTPSTGISLGIERIILLMEEKQMFPSQLSASTSAVFVAAVNDSVREKAIEIAQKLRGAGIAAEYDLMGRDLRKQFDYANARQIPFCAVVGPRELATDKVTLRDMRTGKEQQVPLDTLAERLK